MSNLFCLPTYFLEEGKEEIEKTVAIASQSTTQQKNWVFQIPIPEFKLSPTLGPTISDNFQQQLLIAILLPLGTLLLLAYLLNKNQTFA